MKHKDQDEESELEKRMMALSYVTRMHGVSGTLQS